MHEQCTNNCNVQRATCCKLCNCNYNLEQLVVLKDVATFALLKYLRERARQLAR